MGYSGEAAFHVMAESMSVRAVGWQATKRRCSAVLGSGLIVVAALACSVDGTLGTSGAAADPVATDVRSGVERAQPERVVQRMEPARATLTGSSSGSDVAANTPSASSGASVVSQPSPNGTGTLTAANAPRQVEAISPKHLEAELNRLEAEIGN